MHGYNEVHIFFKQSLDRDSRQTSKLNLLQHSTSLFAERKDHNGSVVN